MVDISKNKYLVNKSENEILDINGKVTINITLFTNKDRTGQVKGIVTDIKNQKLNGVRAKIISKDGKIFLNTQSDENGEFYFNSIPENKIYKIFLIFPDKDNYESNWFKIVEFFEYKELSFTLLDKKKYSIILGSLKTKTNKRLNDREIALFIQEINEDLTLVSVVRTNSKGEFIFSNLIPGIYIIKVDRDKVEYLVEKISIPDNDRIVTVVIDV